MNSFVRVFPGLPPSALDLKSVTLRSGSQILVRSWAYGTEPENRLTFETLLGLGPGSVMGTLLDIPDKVATRDFDGRPEPTFVRDPVEDNGVTDGLFGRNRIDAHPTRQLEIYRLGLRSGGHAYVLGDAHRIEAGTVVFSFMMDTDPPTRFDVASITETEVNVVSGEPDIATVPDK